jgi:phosphate/sulfate permease
VIAGVWNLHTRVTILSYKATATTPAAAPPTLQVGSSAGFAMVFALLVAAILWNLGAWWLGIDLSGCTQSELSQGTIPFDSALANDLSF